MPAADLLSDLKACATLSDLAYLLGYEPKALSYILFQIPDDQKYIEFTIPKKSGGERSIAAPVPHLRLLQKKVSTLLYECVREIKASNPKSYNASYAFSIGASIADNARRHRNRRWVFNLDLQDFFHAIHIGRIRGFFSKDNNFKLVDKISLTLAQICSHHGCLPQGAPTSPIVSNLIGSVLDARLAAFANKHKCRYSRYADDITFSTNAASFPAEIAVEDDSDQGWKVADDLASRIQNAGFSINAAKTRMSSRASRQVVTGLVVNSKVNVPQEYYKATRAMCHRLFTGEEAYENNFFVEYNESQPRADLNHVEGRLSFQYFIRTKFDERSLRERQDNRSSFDKLYRDFLLFKLFFRPQKPLIITEGDSDRIYLQIAAKKLFSSGSDFVTEVEGQEQLTFRVLARSHRLVEVLGLGGGTGNLVRVLVQLRDFVRKHAVLAPYKPVVLLIDNDSGSKEILKQAKSLYGQEASKDNSTSFLKLRHGLYIIRTPNIGTVTETFIESFLPEEVLKANIEGKTFCPEDKFDTSKHFGKVKLAQHVAKHASTISFAGYVALFDRIGSAFHDFQT